MHKNQIKKRGCYDFNFCINLCGNDRKITSLFRKLQLILLLSGLLNVATAQAVTPVTLSNPDQLNFGFATYLGSGIYKAGEQDVQVYQIPLSYTVKEPEETRHGVIVHLPVTLGFFDIDTNDIINNGPPEDVSTISLVPGVEFGLRFTEHWLVSPFFDMGIAKNNENSATSTIYGTGVKSRYYFVFSNLKILLGNNFLYAKQSVENADDLDFSMLESGLDFQFNDFSLFDYHLANVNFYYANFRYFDDLKFLQPEKRPVEVEIQNEIGITFGIKYFQRYHYIDIPRIGIGYRKGDGVSVYRLVLGFPF